jgi:hypothetical protein
MTLEYFGNMKDFFRHTELELWGKYSGDWNPIHYDLEAARSAGLRGVIVHGMLASVPLQEALLSCIENRPEWLQMQLRFRSPVAVGDCVTTEVGSVADGVRGTLYCGSVEPAPAIYGSITHRVPENPQITSGWQRADKQSDVEIEVLSSIAPLPWPLNPVTRLNIETFSLVVRSLGHIDQFPDLQIEIAHAFGGSRYSMLQTSQTVIFRSSLLDRYADSTTTTYFSQLPLTRSVGGGLNSGVATVTQMSGKVIMIMETSVAFKPIVSVPT